MHMYETLKRAVRFGGLGFAGLVMVAGTASADAGADIAVGVTVTNSCTISSTPLAFPGYDSTLNAATPVGANATLTVTCTSGLVTAVTLNEGENADAGSAPATPVRRMTDGTNFLNYVLNQDSQAVASSGVTAPHAASHDRHRRRGRVDGLRQHARGTKPTRRYLRRCRHRNGPFLIQRFTANR